jgi:hypothetical protein
VASTGKYLLGSSYVFVGGRWVQEILGVGQTVGANRAQIGQLEMVVAVPVWGRRIGERGIRYHKRRERNEREQKKRTEKEKKDKKEKQKNCVNAWAHVSLFFLDQMLHALVRCHTHCFLGANLPTCQLTIPKCTREVVRRC